MTKWIVESIGASGVGSMAQYETVTLIPEEETFEILEIRITCRRGKFVAGVRYDFALGGTPSSELPHLHVPGRKVGTYGPHVTSIVDLLSHPENVDGMRVCEISKLLDMSYNLVSRSIQNHKGKLFRSVGESRWKLITGELSHVAS